MNASIAGYLIVFSARDVDGAAKRKRDVLIEAVEHTDGHVEIAYEDRGERIYLKWMKRDLTVALKAIER